LCGKEEPLQVKVERVVVNALAKRFCPDPWIFEETVRVPRIAIVFWRSRSTSKKARRGFLPAGLD
jgi:hypothetical protein